MKRFLLALLFPLALFGQAKTNLDTLTVVNQNGVLAVGIGAGQYQSIQAAHDALPAGGGTIQVMGNATPFGPSFNTPLAITKPVHIIVDDANFTAYSGASAMISCSGVNGVTIEGSGHTGSDTGTNGTTFNVSSTTANGIAFSNCSGAVLRNFNLVGPGQGTGSGKGILLTANRNDISDVNVRSWGSDCITVDGSVNNANVSNIIGGRASLCGGNDYVTKGVNGQLIRFIGTDGGPSTGDCYNISNALNIFLGTNCSPALAGNNCYHFLSGAVGNVGTTFCDSPATTGYKFDSGANSNLINNSFGNDSLGFSDSGSGNRYYTGPSVINLLNAVQYGLGSNMLFVTTAPTVSSGFGTSPSIASNNGTAAFTINVGTGGTATNGVIGLPTAALGWVCTAQDLTTQSATVFVAKQIASSATTATIANFNTSGAQAAWVASDILHVSCIAR